MNIKNCFIIFLLMCRICAAQNLVPNGSFEIITNCPSTNDQLSFAPPWHTTLNTGQASSDLFNGCNTTGWGVPVNPIGFQNARTGSSYAGFFCYGDNNVREYIQVQLNSSLTTGTTYNIEMYVSPGDLSGIAIDSIGIFISSGMVVGNGTHLPLSFTPQVSNPAGNIISDTAGWSIISGLYTATGGENHITIGNFSDDANTDTLNFGGMNRGYYYVDDVSVSPLTSVYGPESKKLISVFPNPFSDDINIKTTGNIISEIILYDISSRRLLQQEFTNSLSLNTESLAKGMYIYEIHNKNGTTHKGTIVKE